MAIAYDARDTKPAGRRTTSDSEKPAGSPLIWPLGFSLSLRPAQQTSTPLMLRI